MLLRRLRSLHTIPRALCLLLSLSLLPGSAIAEASLINVETIKDGETNIVIANNLSQIPITVTVTLTSATNIASSVNWPIIRLLRGGETAELVRVTPDNKQQRYAFAYQYEYMIGQPNVQATPGAKYLVPFVFDRALQISQASDGPIFSHHDVGSKNAIDIPMPIGTPVIATRSGTVIQNINQFSDNGQATTAFLTKANSISILHDDGTWAQYLHLKQFSSRVSVGQKVTAGMPIALSGNSGFSSEPHLHFVLQKNENGTIVSLPIKFWTTENSVVIPRYRSWLTPGQAIPAKSKMQRTVKDCSVDAVIDEATLHCMQKR